MTGRPSPATSFVGRDAELAALRARIDALAEGTGGIVLLAGEPGIGKTRLAHEAATAARARGIDVSWGAAYEDAWSPPFGPWVEVLRALAESIDPIWLRGRLGPGAPLLTHLVPELRPAVPEGATAPDGEQARFHLYDAAGRMLTDIAERQKLLIVLDDLHWADGDSLGLVRHVAHLTARAPILLLGAYRDTDLAAGHPLMAVLTELRRNRDTAPLTLGSLSPEEVTTYLSESVTTPDAPVLSRAVYAETSGNPFFVCEMARHLAAGGTLPEADTTPEPGATGVIPAAVRQVLAHRLAALPEPAVAMLRAACIFPGGVEFEVLAAITGMDEDALLDALDQTARAGLLRPVEGGRERYSFTHAIVRNALYDGLTAGRRIRGHRRAAEVIEELRGADAGAYLAELAYHALRAAPAGDTERAVEYARRAGDHAFRMLAFDEAARLFEQALGVLAMQSHPDVVTRCELLLALGGTRMRAAKAGAGRTAFAQGWEAARGAGRPDLMARAALGYVTFIEPGEVEESHLRLLREALAALDPEDTPARAMLTARLAMALYWADDAAERTRLSGEAIAMARRLGDPALIARTIQSGGFAVWGPDDVHERLANSAEVIRLATGLNDDYLTMAGRSGRIVAALELGDIASVDRDIAAYAQAATQSGYPPRLWMAAMFRAMRAILAGRLDEAERLVAHAYTVGRGTEDNSGPVQYFGLQMFALRLLQGRGAELGPTLTDLAKRQPHIPAYPAGLALIYAEAGQADAARALFERLASAGFERIPRDLSWLITVTNLAQVCAVLGDRERAVVLYDMLRPHEGQWVISATAAACYGSTGRSLGLLASVLGRPDDADAHFTRALALHEGMGAAPWVAQTAYDHAVSLLDRPAGKRTAESRERARELLGRAGEIARGTGMAGLAALVDARAESASPAPSEPVHRAALPAGLTAREADVLRLIAAGRTNKEIADALVVSLATVERHITNLYGKIDARGRADATTFALRHGLVAASRR